MALSPSWTDEVAMLERPVACCLGVRVRDGDTARAQPTLSSVGVTRIGAIFHRYIIFFSFDWVLPYTNNKNYISCNQLQHTEKTNKQLHCCTSTVITKTIFKCVVLYSVNISGLEAKLTGHRTTHFDTY